MESVEQSLLVGQVIQYSVKKDTTSYGEVVDKVLAKEAATDTFAITKYLVEDLTSRQIVSIASWRVLKMLTSEEVDQLGQAVKL